MKYPKECPAFEVVKDFYCCDAVSKGAIIVGAGLNPNTRRFLSCHPIENAYNHGLKTWPFNAKELKPLTASAEEMLSWVKP